MSFIIPLALACLISLSHVAADASATPPGEPGNGAGRKQTGYAGANPKKPVPGISTLSIEEYYKKASAVNAPELPDGLRVSRRGVPGSRQKAPPVITSQCLRFAPGEFSRLFLRSPYSRRLRELFVEAGIDAGKMTNLLIAHSAGGKEIVSIFDEGYMILFDRDESTAYTFPINKGMGEKVFSLTR